MRIHSFLLKPSILILILTAAAGAQVRKRSNPSVLPECTEPAVLGEYQWATLFSAQLGKRDMVTVQLLSRENCAQVFFGALAEAHAQVLFADQKVGYALVQTSSSHVLNLADLRGLEDAEAAIDEPGYANPYQNAYQVGEVWVPPADKVARSVPELRIPIPKVASSVPEDGPYFAAEEAGLLHFWKEHHVGDGRGVRVAVFDSGFDLLHPALRSSLDGDGNPVPKIRDIVAMTQPDADPNWVRFGEPVSSSNGHLSVDGRSWGVPYEGTFRFGVFNRNIHLGDWLGTQNDPHIRSVEISVGVLWDPKENRFWVDTDGDGSFANQHAIGDYGSTHDVDYFGRVSGVVDNRIPFAIKVDVARSAAFLSIADSSHGTMVAGALAANRTTGGLIDAAAPNAQLIDARHPSRNYFLPLLLQTLARSDVDVANWSGPLGLQTADGRNDFVRRVLERALQTYDKPMACVCSANRSILVLDYQSPEMLRRNRQIAPPYGHVTSGTVIFVPHGNGFVNTVVAPSTSLLPESRYRPSAQRWEDGRIHITGTLVNSPAPDGYKIGDNPSPTIPVVSGVLADLISEARREQVRYDSHRLTRAVLMGARLLPGVPTSRQGFGIVDAAGAWERLKRMANADDRLNPELTHFRVSRRRGGKLTSVEGLQDDFIQSQGTVSRELWITRHGGYSGKRAYRLDLRGNDGTYRLLKERIILDQNSPTLVRLRARLSPGLHLAFLQLFDVAEDAEMDEIPLLLRAPEVPQRVSFGVERFQANIPPLDFTVRYFRLPPITQAARFLMTIPSDNPPPTSFRLMPGLSFGPTTVAAIGEPLDLKHHVGPIECYESVVHITGQETMALGWGNRPSPEYATPYDAPAPEVSIHGTVQITRYAVRVRQLGNKATLTNRLADVKGRVKFYDARIRKSEEIGLGPYAVAMVDRFIAPLERQWRVTVSIRNQETASVSAYVFHCDDSPMECSLVDHQPLRAGRLALVIDDPHPGHWKLVVARRSPEKVTTLYEIREALLQDSPFVVENKDMKRTTGERWSLHVPPKTGDVQYVGFQILGATKNVSIAMTALRQIDQRRELLKTPSRNP